MSSPGLTWLHVSDLHLGHGDVHYRVEERGHDGYRQQCRVHGDPGGLRICLVRPSPDGRG